MSGLSRRTLRRHREDGAVAVEFALVLPLLIMLLFGVFTTGMAYSDHLSITNAVREGSRLGSAIDYSPSPTTWANSVQQRVQQVYFNAGSTIAPSQVCVLLRDSAGLQLAAPTSQGSACGTEPTAPTNPVAGSCIVKVWVMKPQKISLIVFPDYNFSIGAQSVSYYGRAAGTCKAS